MPQIFGWEHITYSTIVISITIGLLIAIKKHVKKVETNDRIVKATALILLIMIIWNRITISLDSDLVSFLPDSYCGTSSLVLALITLGLKKDNAALHSVAYTGLLGAILTHIYPDFIGQHPSVFYPKTISGLLHHSVMMFLVLLMLVTGYMKPRLKKWHLLPIGLSFYISYGVFLITMLDVSNPFYIYKPVLDNTPFNWFGLGIIFIPVHAIFLYVWERVENNMNTNKRRRQFIN